MNNNMPDETNSASETAAVEETEKIQKKQKRKKQLAYSDSYVMRSTEESVVKEKRKKSLKEILFNPKTSYTLRKPLRKWWFLFLLPVTAAFAIGFVWPFIQGVYLSFCEFQTVSDAKFIGPDNYVKAFSDQGFMRSFGYTAVFALVSLFFINIIAFAVAIALTKGIKGSTLFRTVFFMPNLIGGIVLGYIWSMLFDGVLSAYEDSIVTNSTWGFWGLIVLVCWQQIGYMMIIYIAGLNAIPDDLFEAARIDGANSWQILWNVTIPNVMPSITICMFLSLTNGFKLFDQNLALTAGKPYNTNILRDAAGKVVGSTKIGETELIALRIYNTFYGNGSKNPRGLAQAEAVLFFILVAVIGLIQLAYTRKKEVQQ